ncbi:MAG TPA: sulfurtransferase/chromate resistance protein [Sphingomicrobium sp.]|nr:sulfurtransferase/chromate resistance protein [Sphingomicrobium sp.]
MPALNAITADKLIRLIGTPNCPAIVDVRSDGAGLIPTSVRREAELVTQWGPRLDSDKVVVACAHGGSRSTGVAAWLRHQGLDAEILEGGFDAWVNAGLVVLNDDLLPPRDEAGRTRWVTRARPKVDRIACPWLIRRFVDPAAIFLFVPPADVAEVAERFDAAPFDVDGVFWSHRGEHCSFDTMVEEIGLGGLEALRRLALIVRGADTARPELAPQAAGLLAASLGLSRMYADDLEQLEAGMLLYDSFYRWCRDATDETHDWVSHQPKGARHPVSA